MNKTDERLTKLEESISELADAFKTPASNRKKLGSIGLEYVEGPDDKVFVRVPTERGRWVLCHPCVVTVACSDCLSLAGEPCKNQYHMARGIIHYWSDTHAGRRQRHNACRIAP